MRALFMVYMIDGVRVPKRTWESRQQYGEYAGADFSYYEVLPSVEDEWE